MRKSLSLIFVSLCCLGACEGDNPKPDGGNLFVPSIDLGEFYQIEAYSRNSSACDSEGDSVLEELGNNTGLFIDYTVETDNQTVLLYGCQDATNCAELKEQIANNQVFSSWKTLAFSNDSATVRWEVDSIQAGSNSGANVCTGAKKIQYAFIIDGSDQVTLREETIDIPDFPADANGFCNTAAADEASQGLACSSLEIFSAERVTP